MATIEVKEIRANGKKIKNVDGKPLRALNYGGNIYVIQNNVFLTINTNNDYETSETWELEKGTYVSISDALESVSAGDKTIYAGSKSGYEFNGWDKSSFNIQSDETIEGLWKVVQTLLGTATINFVWYKSSQQLVCATTSYSGEVGSSSVESDQYWNCPIGIGIEFDINFYDTSGSYIGTERFSFIPTAGDDDIMYPSLTYNYYN